LNKAWAAMGTQSEPLRTQRPTIAAFQ
jgi:hypothetical protein